MLLAQPQLLKETLTYVKMIKATMLNALQMENASTQLSKMMVVSVVLPFSASS